MLIKPLNFTRFFQLHRRYFSQFLNGGSYVAPRLCFWEILEHWEHHIDWKKKQYKPFLINILEASHLCNNICQIQRSSDQNPFVHMHINIRLISKNKTFRIAFNRVLWTDIGLLWFWNSFADLWCKGSELGFYKSRSGICGFGGFKLGGKFSCAKPRNMKVLQWETEFSTNRLIYH